MINEKRSTILEQTGAKHQGWWLVGGGWLGGGLKLISLAKYSLYNILLFKYKKMFSLGGGILTFAMYHLREKFNITVLQQRKWLLTRRQSKLKKNNLLCFRL